MELMMRGLAEGLKIINNMDIGSQISRVWIKKKRATLSYHLVLQGTLVVAGRARGVVVATGPNTAIGKIRWVEPENTVPIHQHHYQHQHHIIIYGG